MQGGEHLGMEWEAGGEEVGKASAVPVHMVWVCALCAALRRAVAILLQEAPPDVEVAGLDEEPAGDGGDEPEGSDADLNSAGG